MTDVRPGIGAAVSIPGQRRKNDHKERGARTWTDDLALIGVRNQCAMIRNGSNGPTIIFVVSLLRKAALDVFNDRDDLRLGELPRAMARKVRDCPGMKAVMNTHGPQIVAKRVGKNSQRTLSRAVTVIAPIKSGGKKVITHASAAL